MQSRRNASSSSSSCITYSIETITSSRKWMPPPPRAGIERVSSLRILGVIVNDRMTTDDHVTLLLSSFAGHNYFAPLAFPGSIMRRQHGRECVHQRIGYSSNDLPSIAYLFNSADDGFFNRIKINSSHVLQPYLPNKINLPYQLRTRSHNITLINKTKLLSSSDFIVLMMLYKYSY